MTDEQIRAAYGRAIAARAAGDRVECPTPEAIEALVRREGDERSRLTTLDHVMACQSCRREFELLRSIDTARARQEPARRSVAWHRPLALALAASVMFAVVLGPGRSVWRDWRSDGVRGTASGIALVRPADGATAGGDSLRFVWRPVDGAPTYTLELMTADGSVQHGATTRDTTLLVRGMSAMPAGDYRWWVRARLAGGEVQSELKTISVRR